MTKLSVIIPVYNGGEALKTTVESLVNQSVEDFEVIIVDDGSTDDTEKTATEYCEEYVDFFYIKQTHESINAARNKGIERARGDFLLFLDCGDILSTDSIESAMEKAKKNDLDLIIGRKYSYGDIEYEFDKHCDSLVLQSSIDRLNSNLLWIEQLGNVILSRKFTQVHNLRFLALPVYGEYLFFMECVMRARAIGGCPDFILESLVTPMQGYKKEETPSQENLDAAKYVLGYIYDLGWDAILRETGNVDGDESYLQSIVYRSYSLYLDNFYRKYWYCTDDLLLKMRDEFTEMSKLIKKELFDTLAQNNSDLRLPYIYVEMERAVKESLFSLMIDVKREHLNEIITSIYIQNYPFFEVVIRKSDFESDEFPAQHRDRKNIIVIDSDKNFFALARQNAHGRCFLTIRGSDAIDYRVLRETAQSNMPKSTVQYVFGAKRKQLSARKTLKDKGLVLNDR